MAGDSESAEAMRDLIETVAVFRDPSRLGGVEIEFAGQSIGTSGREGLPQ